jgi:hypothetical protein
LFTTGYKRLPEAGCGVFFDGGWIDWWAACENDENDAADGLLELC